MIIYIEQFKDLGISVKYNYRIKIKPGEDVINTGSGGRIVLYCIVKFIYTRFFILHLIMK